MSRTLPTGYAALTTNSVFRPVFLVELDWPGGNVYAWNGYGTISWSGNSFLGTGELGKISEIRETSTGRATGISLSMSGIPSSEIVHALANDAQGQPGKVWFASLARDGAFEADPYLIFDGLIDVCPISEGADTSTITVKLEKELIDRRQNSRRRTHEDQQIDAPGDLYFQFVAGLAQKQLTWGGATAAAGTGAAPGSASPGGTGGGGIDSSGGTQMA